MIKTVLAPNAPWPKIEPVQPKAKPKKKAKPPSTYGKRKQTDANFDKWLGKVEVVKC